MDLATVIEKVLTEKVRPVLQAHGGDIGWEEIRPETRRLQVHLTGACSHCPGTAATLEHLVESSLREVWPGFEGVDLDTGVSKELIDQAYKILRKEKRKT
ncbi:MAG: NifU family protein [Negativicutes bacterium]|nr:NifU family protein [Negativicutes bacterium]